MNDAEHDVEVLVEVPGDDLDDSDSEYNPSQYTYTSEA
jgi:hypothetical protein